MDKNEGYNPGQTLYRRRTGMSKRVNEKLIGFGARLAQLRKAAGYTQVELAAEIGVSQRNVAYYEGQTQHPPTAILPELARALGVTADDLLGVTPIKRAARPTNTRLLRRFQQIEKLDAREKRQILQFLDTFIEREQLRKRAGAQ